MLDKTNEPTTAAEIVLEAGAFSDALRRVRHAICGEETRYYLNGVYVHHVARDKALRLVATDGHRLAAADIPAPEEGTNIRPAILSRAFVADAIKATKRGRDARKRIRLGVGQEHVWLTDWDRNMISGKLVDGTFPDYERVIPRGDPKHGWATLAREPFLQAVAAVTSFAEASESKRPAVRFAFAGDKLTLSTSIEDRGGGYSGSAAVTVNIAAAVMPEPRDVGFYGPFVLDILRSLKGRLVRFDFFAVGGPNNFSGDHADGNALHTIMPVRI